MSDTPSEPSLAEAVAVVGVGLIGGSIAAALKRSGFAGPVIGVGRNARRLELARARGLIDSVAADLCEAAPQADLFVFCTPVDRIVSGVLECAPHCRPGTLLTDAGSVKGAICRELAGRLPPGVTFIGSHPLAGSEKNGFEHAQAHLFEQRVCVVTPDAATPADQLERLTAFWRRLGLTVLQRPAEDHDRILAETSHLPHLVAAALAATLGEENRPLAATGFRDTTRIAAGDPELWAAILLANADAVLAAAERFGRSLTEFHDALTRRDAPALKNLLTHAKTNRDALNSCEEASHGEHRGHRGGTL